MCMKLKLALQRLSVEAEMRPVNSKLHKTVSYILCGFHVVTDTGIKGVFKGSIYVSVVRGRCYNIKVFLKYDDTYVFNAVSNSFHVVLMTLIKQQQTIVDNKSIYGCTFS